jgi:hypothetical protein
MSILQTAIAANRLDLAAHTLVLAAAKTLIGENLEIDDRKENQKTQLKGKHNTFLKGC